MRIILNGVVLEMVTRITRAFTDGNGLDTVVIVEGTVNNRPVTMEFDGQMVPSLAVARERFHANAWKRVI
jgi:hypothetical protein